MLAACETTQVTDDRCYPGSAEWPKVRDTLLARPGMTFIEIEDRERFMAIFNAAPAVSNYQATELIGYFDGPGARSVHVVWINGNCLMGQLTVGREAWPEFFREMRLAT
jgi:hypothetical protein